MTTETEHLDIEIPFLILLGMGRVLATRQESVARLWFACGAQVLHYGAVWIPEELRTLLRDSGLI